MASSLGPLFGRAEDARSEAAVQTRLGQ